MGQKTETSKFFYHGEFFETEEEFWKYVENFSLTEVNEEKFHWVMHHFLATQIWPNLEIHGKIPTGKELHEVVNKLLLEALLEFEIAKR